MKNISYFRLARLPGLSLDKRCIVMCNLLYVCVLVFFCLCVFETVSVECCAKMQRKIWIFPSFVLILWTKEVSYFCGGSLIKRAAFFLCFLFIRRIGESLFCFCVWFV